MAHTNPDRSMVTANDLPDGFTFLKRGVTLSDLRLDLAKFSLSGEVSEGEGDRNVPVVRDDVWQDMLRMGVGHVPENAKHAPPCYCELTPSIEKCNFSGLAGLPPAVRLMDGFFPVRDQSKRGACFAFALAALCEYMLGKTVELSEQSLFHFTKLVTPGKVENQYDGAVIADSIRAVEEYGICPLSEWHYNPESWNYVEDPYNEGQGKALQRKLEAAQQYRFHNWRWLPNGSVIHFKQALSAKLPIYTGVFVTTDWDDAEVRRTGVIPLPKLHWRVCVHVPPRGLVEKIMAGNGIAPDAEDADVIARQFAAKLMNETIQYIGSAVFGCEFSICDVQEEPDRVEFIMELNKICGGHALCLAGYVDDNSYPGGGYFIARNSWSSDKWAPDSPELAGYALIPYAYIAAYGHLHEGVVMSGFPSDMQKPATSVSGGTHLNIMSNVGFEAWLSARKSVLSHPVRDAFGVLLRPGTPVLFPDPSQRDNNVLRDTPANRAKLMAEFDREIKKAEEICAELLEKRSARAAAEREARFIKSLRETIDGMFAADEYAVMTLPVLKDRLLAGNPDLAEMDELDRRIRDFVIELQGREPQGYWFGQGFGGVEELRPSGVDSGRIKG